MKRHELKSDALGNQSELSNASNIVDVTGALTLTIGDSGKKLVLRAAAGAEIELPAVTAGKWEFEIYVGSAFATTNWTVVSTTNVIQGGAIVNSVYVPGVNENTISFVATAETIGDFVRIFSDGTNILSSGVGALAGSITYTAP